MSITLDQIKAVREATGAATMSCKKALEETNGDFDKAVELLRKKGEAKAKERSERSTGQGIVASYIHNTEKVGVLLQLGCETDFVARNEEFKALAKDLALHVAAMSPLIISPDEVSSEMVAKEREIWTEQLRSEGKKEEAMEKILAGKEKKFREESALLTQAFVKNPDITVEQLITGAVTKMGENIKVVRFVRFVV